MWHFFAVVYLLMTVPVDAVALYFIFKAVLTEKDKGPLARWWYAVLGYGVTTTLLGFFLLVK